MFRKAFSLSHNSKNETIMAIKKQFTKTKPVCKVTFSIEAKEAQSASVVADFNGWDAEAGKLGKQKNGTFKGTFDLPKDSVYEFRYIVDGDYQNEPEADGTRGNDFGSENSVLNT